MNRQDVLKSMLARWRPERGTDERPERMVQQAQSIIDRITTNVLSEGWWFNTEVLRNIRPGVDGVLDPIAIPGCVLMAYGADDQPVTVKVNCYDGPPVLPPEPVPPPVADFTAQTVAGAVSPPSGQAPLVVDFSDVTPGTVDSRLWDFLGDGTATSTALFPRYTYTVPGVYSPKLTVTNASGTDTRTRVGYVVVSSPPPAPAYIDDFEGADLARYVTVEGSRALFTLGPSPYGTQCLTLAASTSAQAIIEWPLPARVTCTLFKVKFRVDSFFANDAGRIVLKDGATTVLAFTPRRDVAFDVNRRPDLFFRGTNLYVAPAAIVEDVWHSLEIAITPTGYTVSVTNLGTSTVVSSTPVAAASASISFTSLSFLTDIGTVRQVSGASYDQVEAT